MKKFYKYLIIFILFTASIYSQPKNDENYIPVKSTEQISVTANASANVIRGVTISSMVTDFSVDDLDFGDIFATGSTQTRSIANSNGRRFMATGQAGRYIFINYTSTVTLSNALWVAQYGGTTSTIPFTTTPIPDGTGANPNYVNPYPIVNGNSYLLINSGGIGTLYIWVGGRITIAANKPAGDYIGTFTISVSY